MLREERDGGWGGGGGAGVGGRWAGGGEGSVPELGLKDAAGARKTLEDVSQETLNAALSAL